MKRIIIILTIFILVQPSSKAQTSANSFSLDYCLSGLGSSRGTMQPRIRIQGTELVYTYEENSQLSLKAPIPDTICVRTIRKSSIDAILDITRNMKKSIIWKVNPCRMSGGVHFITIIEKQDTTTFTMQNTFDRTALKIMKILNPYLPRKKRIRVTEQYIADCEECWTILKKRRKEADKKID